MLVCISRVQRTQTYGVIRSISINHAESRKPRKWDLKKKIKTMNYQYEEYSGNIIEESYQTIDRSFIDKICEIEEAEFRCSTTDLDYQDRKRLKEQYDYQKE